jgi:hypothetical protein
VAGSGSGWEIATAVAGSVLGVMVTVVFFVYLLKRIAPEADAASD